MTDAGRSRRPSRGVPLVRALSKLGVCARQAGYRIVREGRVEVNGRVVRDPAARVAVRRIILTVDGEPVSAPVWRTILFHKPAGVVSTTRDPAGRRTLFDVLGAAGRGLRAVGRLDAASTGLLLLTTDTHLANWLTDPRHAIPRTYVVTVRGRVEADAADRMTAGVVDAGERLRAASVTIRKASGRESHLIVELREGKNREIRRMLGALGHEVTRLMRISFGRLRLEHLPVGEWREISRDEAERAFGPESLLPSPAPAAKPGPPSRRSAGRPR